MKTLMTAILSLTFLAPATTNAADKESTAGKKKAAGKRNRLRKSASAMKADPNNTTAMRKYLSLGLMKAIRLSKRDKKAADKVIETMMVDFGAVKPTKPEAKNMLRKIKKMVPNYLANREKQLKELADLKKKQKELVGKKAAKLEAEMWVNGPALTDKDLKGKVVLLDFWAIWCRPCIATFPHLREWQEKWGDKGLVIIGATKYENYVKWDEKKRRGIRAEDEGKKATPEQERLVLEKFAAHYELKHRIMVAPKSFEKNYFRWALPTAVVIDQQGVVRMIKIGGQPETAAAIEELIEKLLDQKATTTKATTR